MSVRNKTGCLLLALIAVLSGCATLIYDQFEHCPQGVYVSFYAMTPCDTDTTRIGVVPSVTVFAFDIEDKLVTSVTESNPDLTEEYAVLVPVSDGYFSFIAWTGLNNAFDLSTLKPGISTKTDLLAKLKNTSLLRASDTILQGKSAVVYLPDPKEFGSIYKHTDINLREITNSVKVLVDFDQKTMSDYDPQNLRVSVASANTHLNMDGSMPLNTQVFSYAAIDSLATASSGSWNYRMLDLQTGYKNQLKITYINKGQEKTIFDGDLIASILLRTVAGGINLNCDNDFVIRFFIKDYCQDCLNDFSCSIFVNDWVVNSYDSDL